MSGIALNELEYKTFQYIVEYSSVVFAKTVLIFKCMTIFFTKLFSLLKIMKKIVDKIIMKKNQLENRWVILRNSRLKSFDSLAG